MYRALYRKWRPLRFQDVIGQTAIVTALRNQIATGHVGHAYLFTGVRGTGKTTCAKIFAKAINCMTPIDGDPCCDCEACRGIDNGSILDVVEMDAASNNGVDNIRDLRDETAYTPSTCRYKVYIIDEVHMLSTAAFNALLKTLEEPPPHVVFILATTEIQKVPATILSRCQRYDFTRIQPSDLAARALYVAEQEGFSLTTGAADLIARLADGAARDTLSLLDTCAGVTPNIDEEVVRRMAGVTDRSYLFDISDAIATGNSVSAMAKLAELRQKSVDLKRLAEELIQHYRNLMLSCLPQGTSLLSGISPEEETRYMEVCKQIPQHDSVRAIRALGSALEKMSRGNDQRIELELALFALAEPTPQAPQMQATAPRQSVAPTSVPTSPTVVPFASVPIVTAVPPIPQTPSVSAPTAEQAPIMPATAPVPVTITEPDTSAVLTVAPMEAIPPPTRVNTAMAEYPVEELPPPPEEEPLATEIPVPTMTPPPIHEHINEPTPSVPAPSTTPPKVAPTKTAVATQSTAQITPFAPWGELVTQLRDKDPMLYPHLKKSKAYRQGRFVLIDSNNMSREFLRKNKASQQLIKDLILTFSGEKLSIGPYEKESSTQPQHTAEDSLHALESKGLSISITDQ